MEYVLGIFLTVGLLMAAWPWLLLAAVVAVVAYLLWAALRRRGGHLD